MSSIIRVQKLAPGALPSRIFAQNLVHLDNYIQNMQHKINARHGVMIPLYLRLHLFFLKHHIKHHLFENHVSIDVVRQNLLVVADLSLLKGLSIPILMLREKCSNLK